MLPHSKRFTSIVHLNILIVSIFFVIPLNGNRNRQNNVVGSIFSEEISTVPSQRSVEHNDGGTSAMFTREGNIGSSLPNPDPNLDGVRRSGRFQCQEQEEDKQRVKEHGERRCRCPSGSEYYAPVCGSDGQTYHNRCFLLCAAEMRYNGFQPLRMESYGPCPEEEDRLAA